MAAAVASRRFMLSIWVLISRAWCETISPVAHVTLPDSGTSCFDPLGITEHYGYAVAKPGPMPE
jgi:hypothetical protein